MAGPNNRDEEKKLDGAGAREVPRHIAMLRRPKTFGYDADAFPLRSLVAEALGWPAADLERLHEQVPGSDALPIVTFGRDSANSDQGTPFHSAYYNAGDALERILECYRSFVHSAVWADIDAASAAAKEQHLASNSANPPRASLSSSSTKVGVPLYNVGGGAEGIFAAPIDEEEIYFQRKPTFRVQLPNNLAVAEKHVDAMYGHPSGEINYWVPFTRVVESTAVWCESAPGAKDYAPFTMDYGTCLRFWGNQCEHYNKVNTSGETRVSFDFRVIPGSSYRPDEKACSAYSGMPFIYDGDVGYFSRSTRADAAH